MHRAVLVCIALCVLAAPGSARLIAWEATSGLLPWDALIPEADRFTASGQLAFAVLTARTSNATRRMRSIATTCSASTA